MRNPYPRSIDVVAGGQFGSEAKGHVTAQIIDRYRRTNQHIPVVNVRVAGPNAGHTVVNEVGTALPLRTIPVGVVDDNVRLHIAAGSEVDLDVLVKELRMVNEAGHNVAGRMTIHREATILGPEHIYRETGMHERMGSTGKGIGAARADRIMRTAKRILDDDEAIEFLNLEGIQIVDDDDQRDLYSAARVVIEGTQGFGLGLHAGYYPQCTSSDCRPVDFLAMAGLDPTFVRSSMDYTPWLVVRPYPIRVAGNSGPLTNETSWQDLGLPEEKTTVTQKVRRVGHWDSDLVKRAMWAAGPNALLAFTMFDQICPEAAGLNGDVPTEAGWTIEMEDLLRSYEASIRAPGFAPIGLIRMVTTSPSTAVWKW